MRAATAALFIIVGQPILAAAGFQPAEPPERRLQARLPAPQLGSSPSHDRKGVVEPTSYPSPIEMAMAANGSRLYVVC